MPYQRHYDIATLMLDICQPQWQKMKPKEIDFMLAGMAKLGTEISTDAQFRHDYMIATKELYVKYYKKRQEKNYTPPSFIDLDKEIRKRMVELRKTHTQYDVLMPDYSPANTAKKISVSNSNSVFFIYSVRHK